MSWTAELDRHYDRLWPEFERGLAPRQVLNTPRSREVEQASWRILAEQPVATSPA